MKKDNNSYTNAVVVGGDGGDERKDQKNGTDLLMMHFINCLNENVVYSDYGVIKLLSSQHTLSFFTLTSSQTVMVPVLKCSIQALINALRIFGILVLTSVFFFHFSIRQNL